MVKLPPHLELKAACDNLQAVAHELALDRQRAVGGKGALDRQREAGTQLLEERTRVRRERASAALARVVIAVNRYGIYPDEEDGVSTARSTEWCAFKLGDRVNACGTGPYVVCGPPRKHTDGSWLIPHVFPPDDPSADAMREAYRIRAERGNRNTDTWQGLPVYWAPERNVSHFLPPAPLHADRLQQLKDFKGATVSEAREMALEILALRDKTAPCGYCGAFNAHHPLCERIPK